MRIASFFRQHRREFVLGSATVLLHLLALGWLANELGPRRERAHAQPRMAMVMIKLPRKSTPLRVFAPPPQPRVLPPPPVQTPPPPPLPEAAPAPAREQTFPEALAAALAQPGDGASVAVPGAGVPGAEPAPAVQAAVQAAPAPAAAAPAMPVYKVSPPPSADLTLQVARTDADGTRWSGEAAIGWQRAAGRYSMKVEIGISVLITRVNLVVLTSEGALGDAGLMPVTMTEKRKGRALTATHFNTADGTITFSASQASYPLQPGAQDKATIPLQLAAIARGDPAQLKGEIAIQVAEDKDASVYRFVVVGLEEIDTRLGRMQAWHLSRPPVPGSYSSRLDVWLAPGHDWYPVQISNLEASGATTTQTVSKIVVTDHGS